MHPVFRRHPEPGRRDFLRASSCAAVGLTGIVNTLAHLRLINSALAAGNPSDFKALVCLFLNGGNDSNNMLVPRSGQARTDYETARPSTLDFHVKINTSEQLPGEMHELSVEPVSLDAANPFPGYATGFGVHPNARPLQTLFDAEKLAFVCNVGTLVQPGITRATYSSSKKPPQLFSHSDQQLQWQSSVPDKPFTSGWGHRIADLLYAGGGNVSMNISLAGVDAFQVGPNGSITPYVMSSSGARTLSGFGTNYASAVNNSAILFDDANYKATTNEGRRLKALEKIMLYTNQTLTGKSLLEEAANDVVESARRSEAFINSALTAAGETGVDFSAQFANSTSLATGSATSLANQLKMVAQLIAGRSALGNNRQIFFVQVGGYDTHIDQSPTNPGGHNALMHELSQALLSFQNTMDALSLAQQVTLFTASDFNRTLTPNKADATAGTDHAWGGHAIVLGGAVQGGRLYGKFPLLTLGGGIDSTGNRGRWIPSTSVDQYAAVLARWMGVPSSQLSTVLPNLSRFPDPVADSTANLNFML